MVLGLSNPKASEEIYHVQDLYRNRENTVNFAKVTIKRTCSKHTTLHLLSKEFKSVMIFTLKVVHSPQKYERINFFQKLVLKV